MTNTKLVSIPGTVAAYEVRNDNEASKHNRVLRALYLAMSPAYICAQCRTTRPTIALIAARARAELGARGIKPPNWLPAAFVTSTTKEDKRLAALEAEKEAAE